MTTLLTSESIPEAQALVAENARLRAQMEALQIAVADGIAALLPLQPTTRQGQWRRAINRLCMAVGRERVYAIGRDQADHPRRDRQRATTAGGPA